MIEESCNFIEQEHILFYNMKLCIKLLKNTFVYLEIN